ncbi:MAG: FliH/SctL family protein [Planctomycetaceae bacterium]
MTHSTESGRLLKARNCRGLGSRAAFNFEDIERRTREATERARREAGEILAAAQTEARTVRETAFEEARRAGLEQSMRDADEEIESRARQLARRQVDEELKTTLPAVRELADALTRERERWLAEWETGVVRLAVAIAERIVRRTVEADPDVTLDVVRDALQLVAGGSQLRIRLHPQDQRRLGEFAGEFARKLADLTDVQFLADDSLSPGGCLLETEHGCVDARLETQLNRIFDELTT